MRAKWFLCIMHGWNFMAYHLLFSLRCRTWLENVFEDVQKLDAVFFELFRDFFLWFEVRDLMDVDRIRIRLPVLLSLAPIILAKLNRNSILDLLLFRF